MQAIHNVTWITPLKFSVLTLLISSSIAIQNAAASTFTYHLGYRAEYSDNISRVPDDLRWDLINTLTGGFTYLQNTSTFNARVAASASYFDYYRNTFSPQNDLTLDAYGELFFVPQVLSWVAADGFRKVQIDPRQADLPTNRQNSNVFITGPNVYLHLGPVDTVTLEGRYGRSGIDDEDFDVDSERDFFATRWLHRLSSRSTFTLNYEFMDVDYEDSVLNTDFIRQNYFLRGNIHSARNDFLLDLGKTRINLARGEPIDNLLFRFTATRQLNSVSSLGIHYGRENSDTGLQLLPAEASSLPTPGGIQVPLGSDIVLRELFYTELTEISYSWRGNTFPWTARIFSRNIDYELSPSSREEKGWLVDARYILTNALSLVASSNYVYTSYKDPAVSETRDSITGVGLLYRLSRSLTAEIDVRRYERISTIPTQEYRDNRIMATLIYNAQLGAP